MTANSKRVRVPGTGARKLESASRAGVADGSKKVRVTLILRPAPLATDHPLSIVHKENRAAHPAARTRLSRAELRDFFSPDQSHVDAVVAFADTHQLDVVHVSQSRHDVTLEGSVSRINAAFGVELHEFNHQRGNFHAHPDDMHLPESLADIVVSVIGLDQSPLLRRRPGEGEAVENTYTVVELADHYDFPSTTGRGSRVAILNFGKCGFYQSDLDHYFENIIGVALPSIELVPVNGWKPDPQKYELFRELIGRLNTGDVELADVDKTTQAHCKATMEATMDIQLIGGIVPDAKIDVYFAENSVDGFYDALYAALDLKGERNGPPTVISVSWGASESLWESSVIAAIEPLMRKAAYLHVPVCCPSGDLGSLNAKPKQQQMDAKVNYPASSRYAVACGGTGLKRSPNGTDLTEVTWQRHTDLVQAATGGGVSGCVEAPTFQASVSVPSHSELNGTAWLDEGLPADFRGRGVPDVAAFADRGHLVYFGGHEFIDGGTSASTPIWAGLLARLSEAIGRPVSGVPDVFYDPVVSASLISVTIGDNKFGDTSAAFFRAGEGWNGCCGLGVPIGVNLQAALSQVYGAGSAPTG